MLGDGVPPPGIPGGARRCNRLCSTAVHPKTLEEEHAWRKSSSSVPARRLRRRTAGARPSRSRSAARPHGRLRPGGDLQARQDGHLPDPGRLPLLHASPLRPRRRLPLLPPLPLGPEHRQGEPAAGLRADADGDHHRAAPRRGWGLRPRLEGAREFLRSASASTSTGAAPFPGSRRPCWRRTSGRVDPPAAGSGG